MTEPERRHIVAALTLAINKQSEYEREELRFTSDSAQVAAWKDIRDRLSKDQL